MGGGCGGRGGHHADSGGCSHSYLLGVIVRGRPTPVPTPLSWDPGARTRSAAGSFFTCHKLGAVLSLRLTFSSDRM